MDLNIFTLLSEVSHVDILNFVHGVVRAIAPNIYGSNVYDPSQVSNNCYHFVLINYNAYNIFALFFSCVLPFETFILHLFNLLTHQFSLLITVSTNSLSLSVKDFTFQLPK
jgi:hypothetical protein